MSNPGIRLACFALFITFVSMWGGGSGLCADWTLVWSDEFAGPAGQSPDPGNWDYDIGTNWGNFQLEYDTDRPANVSLDGNGLLAITAREESYMGQSYTSARIVTRGLYEPIYGRIEARMKLPTGQGLWPAFWLLGADIATVGWPQCGEIDIMEYRGQEPTVNHGTIHGPGYFGGGGITKAYALGGGRFDTEFHTFAVEWEPGVVRWYVDDALYHTVAPSDLNGNEWVFDHPFYIILNVAVGGTFVGPPDPSTVFPQNMLVDYVRVYRNAESNDSCCVRRGDLNDGGTITSADIIFLINYVFKGGVAPSCLKHGDINDEGTITSADAIALVNYVFKGGAAPVRCPTTEPGSAPAVPAPAPTPNSADVVSLFSDVYPNATIDTWSAGWDNADVEDYLIGSDSTKKYTNLVFAGIEFISPPVDATSMTHFHVDIWTADPTDAPAVFKIKLVDFGADGLFGGGDDVEHEVTFDQTTMNTGEWVSIDVSLATFTGLITTGHVAQLIISGDPNTVYVDNVFFHK